MLLSEVVVVLYVFAQLGRQALEVAELVSGDDLAGHGPCHGGVVGVWGGEDGNVFPGEVLEEGWALHGEGCGGWEVGLPVGDGSEAAHFD